MRKDDIRQFRPRKSQFLDIAYRRFLNVKNNINYATIVVDTTK